jgi:hypothetical protein
MEKIIKGMGKIEFGKFYSENNKIINSLENTPIIDSTVIKKISSNQLKKLLGNNYIYSLLKTRETITIYKTNPINLLSQYRFDIVVKYYYVKSYLENENIEEATKIYLSHIKAFNNFHEPDGKKNSASDFIIKFNLLVENIKKNNVLNKTIIPISMTGIPIDGAHRIAISLYLGLEIEYAVFDLLDGKYDEKFFIKRGMPNEYVKKVKCIFKNKNNYN